MIKNLYLSEFVLLFLILTIFNVVQAGQRFTSTGTATNISEEKACEIALAYSKKEAIEQFGVEVHTETKIHQSDHNGEVKTNADIKIEQQATSIVKVISKTVDVKYDESTKLFECQLVSLLDIEKKSKQGTNEPNYDIDPTIFSEWLSSYEYQKLFNYATQRDMYPSVVEGRIISNKKQYRAIFKGFQESAWYSHHGMGSKTFVERDNNFAKSGYKLHYKSTFKNSKGTAFFNATWIR